MRFTASTRHRLLHTLFGDTDLEVVMPVRIIVWS